MESTVYHNDNNSTTTVLEKPKLKRQTQNQNACILCNDNLNFYKKLKICDTCSNNLMRSK